MDSQLPSPNLPAPSERQPNVMPESLPRPEAAEVAPAPNAAGPADPAASAVPPKLSAADVAAALAATSPVAPAPVPVQTPGVAADVDVIEPEWVDKAEAVVREHQGDPYGEEEAIEALQEDYLQKRYGINVAKPDADDTKPTGT